MDTQLYPDVHPMTFRSVILMLHDKGCWPWMVPVVSIVTKVAFVVAAVAGAYAFVAGQ